MILDTINLDVDPTDDQVISFSETFSFKNNNYYSMNWDNMQVGSDEERSDGRSEATTV